MELKYLPYKNGTDSFMIPKTSEDERRTCNLGLAVPPSELWLGYGEAEEEYLSGGEKDVRIMLELAKASGFLFTERKRILDLGCGAGRMLRHLKELSESCEIWGTDICAEYIYWCKQHLSPPFHFATTTTIPHLPFEDRYFDFIYCGSLFTHIDDLAEAWLLELRRVLSSTGRLYLTIHDNHTMELFAQRYRDHWLAKWMESHDLYVRSKDSMGMLAIGRDSGSQIFYDIDYFCKTVESVYDVLSITQEAYGYQTGILLKTKVWPPSVHDAPGPGTAETLSTT